jgi:nucleoside-diphosphate-sugar epimerase
MKLSKVSRSNSRRNATGVFAWIKLTLYLGVDFICHLAAPVSLSFTDPAPVLHAATMGTTVVLDSAYKNAGPQLRTVVFMSSIAAIRGAQQPPYVFTEADWNNVAEEHVEKMGTKSDPRYIYGASKTAAEKVFWKFRDTVKPNWTMAAVNPV